MLTNYYTLRSLVREWREVLCNATVADCWTQDKGEMSILFENVGGDDSADPVLRISIQSPLRFVYLSTSTARARKNTVSLFRQATGETVKTVLLADKDRLVEVELEGGRRIRIEVFGPRANVYLLDESGAVIDRFRRQGADIGELAGTSRAFQLPDSCDALNLALASATGSLDRRVRRAVPVFDAGLSAEVLVRAGLQAKLAAGLDSGALEKLWLVIRQVLAELESPKPVLYWREDRVSVFSLFPLESARDLREERFESVNEAVQVFVRKKQGQRNYESKYDPLHKLLKGKLHRARRSLDSMASGLAGESRADAYEKFGHLLMALQQDVPARTTEFTTEDIITGSGESITIKLSPELTAVENAQRYYERARETRRSREESAVRLKSLEKEIRQMESLLVQLEATNSPTDVERFRTSNQEALAALSAQGSGVDSVVPYRRYPLQDGYEVWVGRNAAQNDRLTLRDARKHDLWLHARGVAGSHTVLRVPRRNENPPRRVIEAAASIAAFYSKARTSELAPVIVVERRYVRKPRKSPPGTVIVERESVLMVTPKLPSTPLNRKT